MKFLNGTCGQSIGSTVVVTVSLWPFVPAVTSTNFRSTPEKSEFSSNCTSSTIVLNKKSLSRSYSAHKTRKSSKFIVIRWLCKSNYVQDVRGEKI